MHHYTCPYCPRGAEAKLVVSKAMKMSCDHKQGLFFKNKECKKEDFKCKEVMECEQCGAQFKISEDFLDDQKRKIKEG